MITKQDVISAQQKWAEMLIEIGSCKGDNQKCMTAAEAMIKELYAYDSSTVLFKPTKAADIQFRNTMQGAMSYFIGGDNDFPEDHGFTLQPWLKVRFENSGIILENNRALAMGNYFFTNPEGEEVKVEFTFGYIKSKNGKLKIDLHHSSLPYTN